nr:class I SAM-dependent methyltransferase [uncultured Niameybacter sp.]
MEQDVVKDYYDSMSEKELLRLANPYSNIEYETTLYLINKYFSKEGKILDIGCGPGRYSLALLERGYKVSLLDLSQNELDIAKKKITEKGYEAEGYYCQSAMELDGFEDNSFDGILVMGPMYHLHGKENRRHVLEEVKRILKPGGKALIAYINMWGVLKASVYEFPTAFEKEQHFYEPEQGDVEFSQEQAFTRSYFTTPPHALEAIEEAGFKLVSYAGAESFLSGLMLETKNLATYIPDTYKLYVKKACEYCELPQYRDATEHLNIIVEKV